MRIALCLSGIPRAKHCHDFVQRISKYYQTNLFIFYWGDGEGIRKHSFLGRETFSFNPESYRLPGVDLEYKKDMFSSHINEFQASYDQIDLDKRGRKDLGIFGMTYAIYQANHMREQYERKNNMVFDCVFRIRFESGFRPTNDWLDFFDIKGYDLNYLWIPDINVELHTGMNDQFAFSNSHIMSFYSRIYSHVIALSNKATHSPETIFHEYLSNSFFMIKSQAQMA